MSGIYANPFKKNFSLGQRVRIDNTTSVELDGQTGEILGVGIEHVTDCYIILLDNPTKTHKAILLVEACIFPED